MPETLLIKNCVLFDAKDKTTTSILIKDGLISKIGPAALDADSDNVLDAAGSIVAPGFIDVHIQGAGGADTLDGTPEALETISRACARFGTTGFVATTVFSTTRSNAHLAVAARYTGQNLGGANLLGIHLEGPFISPERTGMIQSDCVTAPSTEVLNQILELTAGKLKIMTLAPELPGCLPIIHRLADSGIVASFGHSAASYEQTLAGFDAGISHVTHLFNAMPSIHHRAPGPLVAIFRTESVTTQIICDGVHIHPSVLDLVFNALGPDRVIPITDGMSPLGLSDGSYNYKGIPFESIQGACRYKDGMLIGSAVPLSEMLRRLIKFTKCPLDVAVRTVTENPAKVLGIDDKKGSIAPGKDADLVLLAPDITVRATIVAGNVVHTR